MEERLVVSLSGGGPWGFRLQGGAGTGQPLVVAKVRRKSKAYRRLREGDRIVGVNGQPCDGLTYEQLMDVADSSGEQLHLQILRKECDKENRDPGKKTREVEENVPATPTPVTETPSKTSEENEADSFAQEERRVADNGPTPAALDPFPAFEELQADQNNVTERRHEMKGDTETSLSKTEHVDAPHGLPDITMDTIDLNNLISETQKRLDSFRNNFSMGNGTLDSNRNRTSTSTSTLLSENKETVTTAPEPAPEAPVILDRCEEPAEISKKSEPVKKVPPPTLPKPKIQPTLCDVFKDCLGETETDLAFSLPDIGLTSESSETSTVTKDIPFGSETTTLIKKKKMFSSSSFYEEPHSIYPTVEEQVEMARKIADSLADDTNSKSKGANMFYKRVKRSTKWIHEGPEPSDELCPELESQVPFRPAKGLKLVLDPRHPLDLAALRSSGYVISEHNVVSPEVCHGLVKDLQSPTGKGAALFAKRKKKSEEWVVDEEKVKAMLRERKCQVLPPLTTGPAALDNYQSLARQDVKLVKSPWEAAMESPFGLCDAAFARIRPDQLADTVMKRADYIRSESLSRESSRMEGCVSPPSLTPAAALYDVYHAKAPRGWEGNPVGISPHAVSSALPPVLQQQPKNVQNGFQASKKMVFQNFNAVPRLWKGTSVH